MNVQHKQGFTLIEMLMVIGLIVIVFGLLGPKIVGLLGKKDKAAMQFKLVGIQDALNEYRMELGAFPTSREGLRALVENPRPNDDRYKRAESKWPFLKEDGITDLAGNEVVYNCPPELFKGKYKTYELVYLGPTQSEEDPERLDAGA